jgi:hypothetical protein
MLFTASMRWSGQLQQKMLVDGITTVIIFDFFFHLLGNPRKDLPSVIFFTSVTHNILIAKKYVNGAPLLSWPFIASDLTSELYFLPTCDASAVLTCQTRHGMSLCYIIL